LDFQNLIRFGIPPYNEAIKKYIVTDKKSIDVDDDSEDTDDAQYTFQKVNRIREAPKPDMIQYNGLDVITGFNNYLLFEKDLFKSYPKAKENYQFLMDGHWLFSSMTQKGMCIGEKELNDFETMLDKEIETLEEQIINLEEIQEFNKVLEAKNGKTKKTKDKKQLKDLCFNKPRKIRLISRHFTFNSKGE
jgi:hypothetical protein